MCKHNQRIWLTYFLSITTFVSGIVGCAADRKRYCFEPSPYDRAVARTISDKRTQGTIKVNGMEVELKEKYLYIKDLDVSIPYEDIKISDADVLGFSNDVQKALRSRTNLARRIRLSSGTIQVLAAAAGATLGFVFHSNAETIAALAAVGAIIPELQTIWDARARAAAYTDGLDLIQNAEARYYEKISENGTSTISAGKLTKEGSQLLTEVTTCIKVIDKVLLTHIPTIDELEVATGRVKDRLAKIKVVPACLSMQYEDTQTARVINDRVIAVSIENLNVVKIDNIDEFADGGTDKIKMRGVGTGTTSITVFNSRGGEGVVTVKVVP